MAAGSLTVVGTGIQFVGHLTLAAQAWIEQADKVLFLVADPATAQWLQQLNSTAETLSLATYQDQQLSLEIYDQMVERILACVRQKLKVCAVFYGHPGIFSYPAHKAIQQACREGFWAQILPGISALDCLFADLDLDPAENGYYSFDATDFLIHRRKVDLTSALILWQIGIVGNPYYKSYDSSGLPVLVAVLESYYGPDHEVIVYEAAIYAIWEPVIQRVPLTKLPEAQITPASMLYIPPKVPASLDLGMVARLAQAGN